MPCGSLLCEVAYPSMVCKAGGGCRRRVRQSHGQAGPGAGADEHENARSWMSAVENGCGHVFVARRTSALVEQGYDCRHNSTGKDLHKKIGRGERLTCEHPGAGRRTSTRARLGRMSVTKQRDGKVGDHGGACEESSSMQGTCGRSAASCQEQGRHGGWAHGRGAAVADQMGATKFERDVPRQGIAESEFVDRKTRSRNVDTVVCRRMRPSGRDAAGCGEGASTAGPELRPPHRQILIRQILVRSLPGR
jgi:hypothetical protein